MGWLLIAHLIHCTHDFSSGESGLSLFDIYSVGTTSLFASFYLEVLETIIPLDGCIYLYIINFAIIFRSIMHDLHTGENCIISCLQWPTQTNKNHDNASFKNIIKSLRISCNLITTFLRSEIAFDVFYKMTLIIIKILVVFHVLFSLITT